MNDTTEDLKDYKKIPYYLINIHYKTFPLEGIKSDKKVYVSHAIIFEEFKLLYLKYSFNSMEVIAKNIIEQYNIQNPSDVIIHYIYELRGGTNFRVDASVYDKTMERESSIQENFQIKIGTCALVIDKTRENFLESLNQLNAIVNQDKRLNTIVGTSYEEALEEIKKSYK